MSHRARPCATCIVAQNSLFGRMLPKTFQKNRKGKANSFWRLSSFFIPSFSLIKTSLTPTFILWKSWREKTEREWTVETSCISGRYISLNKSKDIVIYILRAILKSSSYSDLHIKNSFERISFFFFFLKLSITQFLVCGRLDLKTLF
jgi:hypothetical protein